jgi:3',5'-cyclic AMP phosphodiesterase CpdA
MRRLFLVSDCHVDAPANWLWLEQLSDTAYQQDALILAGDVSDNIERLEATLRLLTSKFSVLCFTPGNHDLWVEDGDSLSKLHAAWSPDPTGLVRRRWAGVSGSAPSSASTHRVLTPSQKSRVGKSRKPPIA